MIDTMPVHKDASCHLEYLSQKENEKRGGRGAACSSSSSSCENNWKWWRTVVVPSRNSRHDPRLLLLDFYMEELKTSMSSQLYFFKIYCLSACSERPCSHCIRVGQGRAVSSGAPARPSHVWFCNIKNQQHNRKNLKSSKLVMKNSEIIAVILQYSSGTCILATLRSNKL